MKLCRLTLLFFGLLIVGCNYSKIKNQIANENQRFSLPAEKISELSYAVLAQKVFTPKCVSCHGTSGNVSLENYADIIRYTDLIKKTVFTDRTMPKRGGLSDEELSYLWNWLKAGAPEFPQSGAVNPPTEAEPLTATFASIDKHVFQVSCKDCHNPTGTGKRIALDKESLLNSPLELIIPGNPDESGLIIAIEREGSKRMPPEEDGYAALKEETKTMMRKWIENGAKD